MIGLYPISDPGIPNDFWYIEQVCGVVQTKHHCCLGQIYPCWDLDEVIVGERSHSFGHGYELKPVIADYFIGIIQVFKWVQNTYS